MFETQSQNCLLELVYGEVASLVNCREIEQLRKERNLSKRRFLQEIRLRRRGGASQPSKYMKFRGGCCIASFRFYGRGRGAFI